MIQTLQARFSFGVSFLSTIIEFFPKRLERDGKEFRAKMLLSVAVCALQKDARILPDVNESYESRSQEGSSGLVSHGILHTFVDEKAFQHFVLDAKEVDCKEIPFVHADCICTSAAQYLSGGNSIAVRAKSCTEYIDLLELCAGPDNFSRIRAVVEQSGKVFGEHHSPYFLLQRFLRSRRRLDYSMEPLPHHGTQIETLRRFDHSI